jgi:hypothetical protein
MGGKGMFLIGALAVIAGSLISLSAFIIAKRPSARHLFEKVAPYQGFLGVGLLVWGIYDLLRTVGSWGDFLRIPGMKLFGAGVIAYVLSEIVIGFCLGFGLIASWLPGQGGAEKKGLEIQRKLLGFSMPIGVVGLVSGLVVLYYVLFRF